MLARDTPGIDARFTEGFPDLGGELKIKQRGRPLFIVRYVALRAVHVTHAGASPAVILLRLGDTGISQSELTLNPTVLFPNYIVMTMYNPYVSKKPNRPAPDVTSTGKNQGKKRHGSHRSHIIGSVKFNPSPVTKLHQRGVIWN